MEKRKTFSRREKNHRQLSWEIAEILSLNKLCCALDVLKSRQKIEWKMLKSSVNFWGSRSWPFFDEISETPRRYERSTMQAFSIFHNFRSPSDTIALLIESQFFISPWFWSLFLWFVVVRRRIWVDVLCVALLSCCHRYDINVVQLDSLLDLVRCLPHFAHMWGFCFEHFYCRFLAFFASLFIFFWRRKGKA